VAGLQPAAGRERRRAVPRAQRHVGVRADAAAARSPPAVAIAES